MKNKIFGIVVILIFVIIVCIFYLKNKNKKELSCISSNKIEFQRPEKEIASATIDSNGGVLQKKYKEGSENLWIVINFPKGAVKIPINFKLSLEESKYKVKIGKKSSIAFKIDPDISMELPVRVTVNYTEKYGCDVLAVPYFVDENNKLHSVQLIEIDRENHLFTMDTFHGGRYSWVFDIVE